MQLAGILGALQTIGGIGLGIGQLFKARQFRNLERPMYEISPETQERLGLREQLLQARMPGAQQLERNLATTQQSALYNMGQGATDSASLLAAASAAQGATNVGLEKLAMAESEDYYNRLAGLESAQGAMTQERQRQFEDELADYEEKAATAAALKESGIQNIFGGIQAGQRQLSQMSLLDALKRQQGGGMMGGMGMMSLMNLPQFKQPYQSIRGQSLGGLKGLIE